MPPNNHIKCQVVWSDLHQYYHNFDIGKVGTAFSAMIEAQIALRSSVVKSSNQTQYIGFDFAQIYIKNDCSHCSRLFTGVHRLLESFSLLGLHPGFGRSPSISISFPTNVLTKYTVANELKDQSRSWSQLHSIPPIFDPHWTPTQCMLWFSCRATCFKAFLLDVALCHVTLLDLLPH